MSTHVFWHATGSRGNLAGWPYFPGIHIQGDTFAELQRQFADAVNRLRRTRDAADTWDDLDSAAEELTQMLRFYESVLEEHDVERPHFRESTG